MMKRLFFIQIILVAACGSMTPSALAQDEVGCVRGKPDAPIRIEVFSDYECPACRAFYLQTMKLVFTNYADTGKVCVIYREFPSFTHSREAARLARAALRLGVRQWGQVTEALFQSQPQWSQTGDVEAVVASALGAKDMESVLKLSKDPLLDEVIDNEAILGLERQVNSTPTFFITARGKTEKVEAALTYAAMQRRLDALLQETYAAVPHNLNAFLHE